MNMTPMIDIVFLLIIFFMTVSQVSKIKNERVELPQTSERGSEEQKPSKITVNVNQEGEIIVLGQTMTETDFIVLVSEELIALNNRTDLLTIVMRVDRRAKCRTVNELVSQLESLQVNKVRLAVEKSEG